MVRRGMENDLYYANQQIIMFKLHSFQSGLSSAGVKQCKQCVFDTRCLLVADRGCQI